MGWHGMGESSRTPSVEAGVVRMKYNLSGSPKKLFLLDLHFSYLVSIFLISFLYLFFSSSLSFLHELGFFWSLAFFGPRMAVLSNIMIFVWRYNGTTNSNHSNIDHVG
jgi:hypothetical protein